MTTDASKKIDFKKFNLENIVRILSCFGEPGKLRVLYVSSYDPNYTRTQTLLETLEKTGVSLQTIITGNQKFRHIKAIRGYLKAKKNADVIVVGFRGAELLPLIRLFTSKPIIYDAFVSVWDTLCLDRCLFKPDSFIGKRLKQYDRWLCKLSNIVLVDTLEHQTFFEKTFDANNIDYLYVGCNEKLFHPIETEQDNDTFTVFWYGRANPLQGADVILKAAKLLENENIRFHIVGPVRKKYSELVNELNLTNADFTDFVAYEKLPMEIAKADICLGGHFSDKEKASRVIAGKTFQFLACGKTTIVGDNPANRELFEENNTIRFVKMNEPESLANRIRELNKQ